MKVNQDWNALDEVVSVVMARWSQSVADGTLSADIQPGLPLIRFDFELIEATLTNLVDNALRHGRVPVRVEVVHCGDEVQVSVQDSGSGITEANRVRLFQQFSSTSSKGIGLGLLVCKGLVEAHQGRIWAEFLPRQTRFIFALPYHAYSEDKA